jgi:murein DD-endopeptidase MepM/ murein hydrolase activator NlpD
MTRRWQLVLGDDLIYHESGGKEHADADETVVISLDGTVRELDLTAAHAAELRELLARYLEAGREPGQEAVAPPADGSARRVLKGQGRRRELPGTRDFYRGVRAFAAREGTPVPTAGRQGKKTYVYPDGLVPRYVKHLQSAAGNGDGAAAVLLATARTLGLVPGR